MRLLLTGATAIGIYAAAATPAPAPARAMDSDLSAERAGHAGAALAGAVEGTVRVGATGGTTAPMLSPYARRRYTPPAGPKSASDYDDVIVYVLTGADDRTTSRQPVRVTQRDLAISPRVSAVQAGGRIEFPNEDVVFHNLFSLSAAQPFNLGRYPRGQSRTQHFARPGVVRVFCDIHSDMSAVVLVLDTPHFTRPDQAGRFRIAGLPEGRHRVVAWHESAGADTVTVVVGANATASADLRLSR